MTHFDENSNSPPPFSRQQLQWVQDAMSARDERIASRFDRAVCGLGKRVKTTTVPMQLRDTLKSLREKVKEVSESNPNLSSLDVLDLALEGMVAEMTGQIDLIMDSIRQEKRPYTVVK